MIRDLINQFEKKNIFSSILLIIFAIFLIVQPANMTKTLIIIIGAILVVDGIIDMVNYLAADREYRMFSLGIFEGIVELLTGTLFLLNYEALIVVFPIILGIVIIGKNMFKMQLALNLKQLGYTHWIYVLLISLIVILLGVVILLNPFTSLKVLVIDSGVIILISEIINIIYSIVIIKQMKKIDKTVKEAIYEEK